MKIDKVQSPKSKGWIVYVANFIKSIINDGRIDWIINHILRIGDVVVEFTI